MVEILTLTRISSAMVVHNLALCSIVSYFALLAHALVAPPQGKLSGENVRASLAGPENQSHPTARADMCRCCWRDCEHDSEGTKRGERFEYIGRSPLRIDGAQDVDAWLLMATRGVKLERNMYTPALESIRYGLRNVARDVRIIDTNSLHDMLDGIRGATAKGKRPLVVAIAWWWAASPTDVKNGLKDASALGAYLVLYQTEPGDTNPSVLQTADYALEVNAHEIWDYALANVAKFPTSLQLPVRYIPPGYAPSLDVGVDQNSPSRDETKVGYVGNMDKPMYSKYAEELGERLHATNSIWTRDELRSFLETYPMQLSMHRSQTCCPRDPQEKLNMHMESFRFAELLSNKACIISPPGSDADNQKWASSIHIVEVEDTYAQFERLRAGVRKCQDESFRRFAADFDAERLLVNSGFLRLWSPVLTPSTL